MVAQAIGLLRILACTVPQGIAACKVRADPGRNSALVMLVQLVCTSPPHVPVAALPPGRHEWGKTKGMQDIPGITVPCTCPRGGVSPCLHESSAAQQIC